MLGRARAGKIIAVLGTALALITAGTDAHAISKSMRDSMVKAARIATRNKMIAPRAERLRIGAAYAAYYAEIISPLLLLAGQVEIDNQFPVTEFDPGAMVDLTFEFIDPTTLEPTTGPDVALVIYAVNNDPETDIFTTISQSSDAASHFSIPYTLGTDEPLFMATPFDANGNPIFIAGVDGFNDAEGSAVNVPETPESPALSLLATGLVGLLGYGWRQKKQHAQSLH